MKRIFGTKKEKPPPPTLEDATGRLTGRGDVLDDKIKKIDAQLMQYREQIRKSRPGPPQDAIKRRALTLMKQKKMYEGQRDQLYNQQFNIENTAFALESAKQSVDTVQAMQAASKELKTTISKTKLLNIDKIDKMNDDLADLMDVHNEIQEALGTSYATPDMDEDELMDELDALEGDMLDEVLGEGGAPSYLTEPHLPSAPTTENPAHQPTIAEDDFGLPAVPQRN